MKDHRVSAGRPWVIGPGRVRDSSVKGDRRRLSKSENKQGPKLLAVLGYYNPEYFTTGNLLIAFHQPH